MTQRWSAENLANAQKLAEIDTRIIERIAQCVGLLQLLLKEHPGISNVLLHTHGTPGMSADSLRPDIASALHDPTLLPAMIILENTLGEHFKVFPELGALREMREAVERAAAKESGSGK
jgi:hypothetical protein